VQRPQALPVGLMQTDPAPYQVSHCELFEHQPLGQPDPGRIPDLRKSFEPDIPAPTTTTTAINWTSRFMLSPLDGQGGVVINATNQNGARGTWNGTQLHHRLRTRRDRARADDHRLPPGPDTCRFEERLELRRQTGIGVEDLPELPAERGARIGLVRLLGDFFRGAMGHRVRFDLGPELAPIPFR